MSCEPPAFDASRPAKDERIQLVEAEVAPCS
jgi:hypothetical protein